MRALAVNADVSRADEAMAGVRPYAFFVHPSAVALIEVDEWGRLVRFVWADEPYYPRDRSGTTTTYAECLRR